MKLLKDKYKLLDKLDEDEKIILFLGQSVKEPVANVDIRTLKKRWLRNPDFVQRYTQEFQAMASLDSPLFMKIYDIDFFNDVFFVASEHLEGKTLQTVILEKEKLSLAQVINIITQLTRAFGQAFRENIKYRSLNYSDILLMQNGKIKITQFHIPRNIVSNAGGEQRVMSVSTDIFFIGCLFYELLTSVALFETCGLSVRNVKSAKDFKLEPHNAHGVIPKQIESLKEIIFKCVTSDIASRYQTIDELLNALVKFVQEQVNKTDVLSTMQVDPSKFSHGKDYEARNGSELKPPSIMGISPVANAAKNSEGIKIPSFASPGGEKNAEPACRTSAKDPSGEDPYAILFGKKKVSHENSCDETGSSDAASDEASDGRENDQLRPGPKNVKGNGEMWKNKKTSGGKSMLAKIANFWYSMIFTIVGFLSFLLYIFW